MRMLSAFYGRDAQSRQAQNLSGLLRRIYRILPGVVYQLRCPIKRTGDSGKGDETNERFNQNQL